MAALAMAICCLAGCGNDAERVLTLSGSVVGREGDVVRRQVARFQSQHPALRVDVRATPDAADQRHQLYVQWLNGHATEPDVLQLDVVWTAEFAAAGWIADLSHHHPEDDAFFAPAVAATRWQGRPYALPWFIDVGMLYWRTDLLPHAPRDLDELLALANASAAHGIDGFVWQGARYEGLITVFVEHLAAFGGAILDARGEVAVDSDDAARALTFMRDAIRSGRVPPSVLTWQEEQVRFAFQNGRALFMRNWPYAYPLLQDHAASAVAGRFAATALPAAPGGRPAAALGGSVLAINARSDQPDEAYALIQFLLEPEQMIERARIAGQYPPRHALFDSPELTQALPIPTDDARAIIEHAVPRPVTPVYQELSEMLQIALHRALTGQQAPDDALREAAASMRALLKTSGLVGGTQ